MSERTLGQRAAIEIAGHLRRMASHAEFQGWYDVAMSLRKAHQQAKLRMHPADRRQHGKP